MSSPPETRSPFADDSLRRRVRGGLGWSMANNLLGKLGTFLAGVAMARLLVPEDFGVFAAALAVTQLFLGLNDIGLSATVVRWRGDVERVAGTAMTLILLTSLAFYAAYAGLVPVFADLLNVPGATVLLYVLGLTLISDGLFASHSAVLTRQFLQGRRTAVDTVNLLTTTGVSIGCALAGLGPWSFVWGRLCGNLVSGVLIVLLTPVRIRPRWDSDLVWPMVRFGLPLAGSGLLLVATLNVDYLVVGRLLGPEDLGYYLMAFNLASWPVLIFAFAVARVSLAGFSELAADPHRLQRGFVVSLRLLLAMSLPACVGLAVLAGPIVRVVYGQRWAPAAAVLSLLAVMSGVRIAVEFCYDLLTAVGRPRTVLVLQGVWTVTLLPALVVGVLMDGIRGAGWAHLLVSVVVVLPALAVVVRRAGIDIREVASRCARPVVAALGVVPGAAVALLLPDDYLRLLVGVPLGVVGYLLVAGPLLREAIALGRNPGAPTPDLTGPRPPAPSRLRPGRSRRAPAAQR